MWKKSVQWEICPHEKCGHQSVLSQFTLLSCKIFFFLFLFTLFCCKICSVAIYALLRGEKLKPKIVPVEKKDKYEVCWIVSKIHYSFINININIMAIPISKSFQYQCQHNIPRRWQYSSKEWLTEVFSTDLDQFSPRVSNDWANSIEICSLETAEPGEV